MFEVAVLCNFYLLWLFPQGGGLGSFLYPYSGSMLSNVFIFCLHSVLFPSDHCEIEIFCKLMGL